MKLQTRKKLFAFIIMMMFLSLTQLVFAQKKKCKTCYECLCGARHYGCVTKDCMFYCAAVCGIADTHSTAIPADSVSLSAVIPSYPAQSEQNSTRSFDITVGFVKMPIDIKMQQGINQFEWNAIDENGDALK